MVLLTLIGKEQAKPGARFLYTGPLSEPECKECRLRGVCFNLESGNSYVINELRDAEHPCEIFEGGVRVVEVEKTSTAASVSRKAAIEGSTITFEPIDCDNVACASYRLCQPLALEPGMKLRIEKIEGEIECEKGESLSKAILS